MAPTRISGGRARLEVRRATGASPSTPVASTTTAASTARPAPSSRVPESGVSVLDAALLSARQLRRSDGPEGSERLLSRHELGRTEAAIDAMGPLGRRKLAERLSTLTEVGQAVLMKAVGARASLFGTPQEGAAWSVLDGFADRLRGASDAEIAARVTVLDLDSRNNTSSLNPTALWERRGVIHARGEGDEASDNDGLFQRFTDSCGPTAMQMLLAEADPVVAFAIHDDGLSSDSITDATAAFQRRVLETYGAEPLGRREANLRARLRNGLGRLEGGGAIGTREKAALLAFALEGGPKSEPCRRAIAALREAYDGFPTTAELARLRRRPLAESDRGMTTEEYIDALDRHAGAVTGLSYESTRPVGGFARGQVYRHLDRLEETLRQGLDVPFGISEPGHWMLAVNVRGRGDGREWLIADPDSGRTAWVKTADLKSGDFAWDFDIPDPGMRPYVDTFIFPIVAGDG